ncbi:MAG: beta-ketoacyl-[acyl-carrier-protein] synthase family protein, partial [Chitinophagaceae bacterium]|nr:beta-ketoacyl-[acyl-carrier-protein] synthase family protein [Chitinophagaceae bacterium]
MKINKQARVVITGLGVVSPNAIGVNAFEKAIKEGRSGIRFFPELKNLNFRCQVGGIPELSESDINRFKQKYNVEDILSTGILYGCIAGVEAWQNAGLWNVEDARISGCIFGTGSNGAEATEFQRDNFLNGRPGKLSPKVPIQSLATAVSIYLNKIIGFNGLVTTNSAACNTGAEGILMGYDYISNGLADRILIGGSESSSFFVWSPFDAMFATAQNYNDCP